MIHWCVSSTLGLILTGRPVPLCALVHRAPDCAAKRTACRALDLAFGEVDHCRRVALTYALGRALRA